MSDKEKPIEFSAFDLMPDWAQETSETSESKKPKFDKEYRDDEERHRGKRDRRQGGGRGGNRGDRFERGSRDRFSRGGGDRDRGKGGRGRGRDDHRSHDRPREEPLPQGITLSFQPTPEASKSLSQHIHTTLRAFPLVDLAKMILGSRQRYQVRFESSKDPLFQCKSDGSLWLSKEEAISHFLHSDGLSNYYRVEEIETGPPKGSFSTIAVCGMSGVILGPPNHHEYQRNVAKLHAERFSHMPFEKFRSRIRMENDEETIESWKQSVSLKRQYRPGLPDEEPIQEEGEPSPEIEAVNDAEAVSDPSDAPVDESTGNPEEEATDSLETEEPQAEQPEEEPPGPGPESDGATEEEVAQVEEVEEEEPEPAVDKPKEEGVVLKSDEELYRHFRQNVADQEILSGASFTVSGDIPGRNLSRGLLALLKVDSEKLRRGFPLPMIQSLCKELEKEGLKFFKRGKKALHVCLVRPRPLANADSITDRVQAIFQYVRENPRSLVIDLLDTLVEDFTKPEKKENAADIALSDEAKKVLRDLHWLKSEGYVLEFADTRLMVGKEKQDPPPAKKSKKEKRPAPVEKKKQQPQKIKALAKSDTTPPPGSDDLIEIDAADSDQDDPYSLPVEFDPVP